MKKLKPISFLIALTFALISSKNNLQAYDISNNKCSELCKCVKKCDENGQCCNKKISNSGCGEKCDGCEKGCKDCKKGKFSNCGEKEHDEDNDKKGKFSNCGEKEYDEDNDKKG